MSDRPDFTIEIHQNPYLPVGGTRVHAVARVAAEGGPAASAARSASAAEVIIVDTSASMVGERLVAAKRAAKGAVDALREDVDFAVVSGAHEAEMVYPRDPLLARATDERKADATAAISKLSASGGTRIGRWLTLADTLFSGYRHAIRHTVLLTDGQNEHESGEELGAVLARCAGRFVCDCRGVGADWEPAELRRVATALLGGFGMVADPADLAADFAGMIENAMGKAVADVALRVWTPHGAELHFVKQVYPTRRDLSAAGDADGDPPPDGPATRDYPTGLWGVERRDYHLCVSVPAGRPEQNMLAARVSLVLPGGDVPEDEPLAVGNVVARWTDDSAQSTRRHPAVEHYSKQGELADSVQNWRAAYEGGDEGAAAAELRRARELAEQTGSRQISRRLDRLMDPVTGAVLPKKDVDTADVKGLDTESSESAEPPATIPLPPGEGEDGA